MEPPEPEREPGITSPRRCKVWNPPCAYDAFPFDWRTTFSFNWYDPHLKYGRGKKKALTYSWLYVPAMGAGRCSAQRCRPAKPPSAALWTWARIWTPTWVLCVFQAFSTSPPLVFHSICLKPMQSDLIRSGCVLLCTHKTCLGGRRWAAVAVACAERPRRSILFWWFLIISCVVELTYN